MLILTAILGLVLLSLWGYTKYPNKAVRVSFDQELKKLELDKEDLSKVYSGRNIYFDQYNYIFNVKNSKYRYTFVYWYRTKQTEFYYIDDQGRTNYTTKIIYGE